MTYRCRPNPRAPLRIAFVLIVGVLAAYARGAPRPSVYVVALRDSDLLTMCPDVREVRMADGRTWKSDGKAHVLPAPYQDMQFLSFPPRPYLRDSRDRDPRTPVDLRTSTERGPTFAVLRRPAVKGAGDSSPGQTELGRNRFAADVDVKNAVEREFAKLGVYDVRPSPDGADFVFLAESVYLGRAGWSSGEMSPKDEVPSEFGVVGALGDWQASFRQSALAIVVPASLYKTGQLDIGALLTARVWEGSEVAQQPVQRVIGPRAGSQVIVERRLTFEPASPQALVWQFHGRKPRPPSHPPLCAAYSPGRETRMELREPQPPAAEVPVGEPGSNSTSASARFSAAVTYVSVPVRVVDREGRSVLDLAPSDIHVFEEDLEQKVDRVIPSSGPFDIGLLVDTSTSLRLHDREIQGSARRFVDTLNPLGRLLVASFDRRILVCSELTDDRDRLHAAVDRLGGPRARGWTRLYDALELLLADRLDQVGDRSAIVLFTDGIDTSSRLVDAAGARTRVEESHTPIYAVQYEPKVDEVPAGMARQPNYRSRLIPPDFGEGTRDASAKATEFLRRVAETSGGRLYSAQTLADMDPIFSEIDRELSEQYTVWYYPANQNQDGTYRKIRVEVNRPGVTVRARPGYRAPSAASR